MSSVEFGAPVEFNGTEPYGGDANTVNLNQWFTTGDTAMIILCSCLVLIMVPGIAFLYSGLARRKSALSQMWVVMVSYSVITFQWYFWGYSLAFGNSDSQFIGDLSKFGLLRVLAVPSPGSPLISELLYSFYQLQFLGVTAALIIGAVAERGRVIPAMVFIWVWATLVYCPLAAWVWNGNGWGFNFGVLDYAGGVPVEIGSGLSALAYSWVLGPRQKQMMTNFRPHNVSMILLGTIFLLFGWMGFNGGSAFGANLRAVMACWNTLLTAMFSGMAWCIMDYRLSRKWSMVGWCSGVISGLVAATPASGFVAPWASVGLGIVSGIICNLATQVKVLLKIDDTMDVFAEHGVGGIVGLVWNAFFAYDWIIALDGVNNGVEGGWVNGHWAQLYIQIAAIAASCGYAFVMTAIIAFLINIIPGLKLRASDEAELLGMDDDQHGEFAYDYVEVRRDYLAWTPAQKDQITDTVAPQHGIPELGAMSANKGSNGVSEATEKAENKA